MGLEEANILRARLHNKYYMTIQVIWKPAGEILPNIAISTSTIKQAIQKF